LLGKEAIEPRASVARLRFGDKPVIGSFARLRHGYAMAVLNEPDNTPLPGTVFTPRQVRVLKIAVIAMGILLVGGFAFVLGTIVYQASRGGQDRGTSAAELSGAEAELPIPKDATVTSMSLDGERLALHLNSATGAEIIVLDLKSGTVISRVKLKPH
jgi:hypothetical protein